ncbi:MAG: phage tail protein [Bacteroidota bacterium]
MMPSTNPFGPSSREIIPPGSIMAYAGKILKEQPNSNEEGMYLEPYGWLVCDGRQLKVAEYPMLYQAIGNLYDLEVDKNSDEADVTFRIPDYRGYFLRMVDESGKVDQDNADRKLANGTVNSGVGSMQEDAIQEHYHGIKKESGNLLADGTQFQSEKAPNSTGGLTPASSSTDLSNELKVSINENRPKNMSVYYIIKYT